MGKTDRLIALFCLLLTSSATFAQAVPTVAPGTKYVALGSSFAAGPGVATQLGNCGRSDHNYSHLVAAQMNLELTDVSCNGATIANILDTPQNGAAPQISAVDSDTGLVTVTIGGNDIQYTSSTFACSGTPASARCTANLDQATINEAVNRLPARLGTLLETIKARAPQAVIVVVTYPRVFTEDALSCSEIALSAEDTRYLATMGEKLEAAFVSATSEHDSLIADAYVLGEGHGPCATSERWVNGANVADTGIRYHPTSSGHNEMARLVLAALGRN